MFQITKHIMLPRGKPKSFEQIWGTSKRSSKRRPSKTEKQKDILASKVREKVQMVFEMLLQRAEWHTERLTELLSERKLTLEERKLLERVSSIQYFMETWFPLVFPDQPQTKIQQYNNFHHALGELEKVLYPPMSVQLKAAHRFLRLCYYKEGLSEKEVREIRTWLKEMSELGGF